MYSLVVEVGVTTLVQENYIPTEIVKKSGQ